MRRFLSFAVALLLVASPVLAQVRVNPTGVNVNIMDPTTVFLTFGGLRPGMRVAEAFWCGELVSAAPDIGNRCRPGTIFGQLPARYDLSRASGQAGFTDIMSIPASVARRAWQDARRGATASFFYVRRFVSATGGRDEFVAVTCRPSAGGARTPLSLTDVRVQFEGGDDVHFLQSGEVPAPFAATVAYNGTGRLLGRWEVVLPAEEGPRPDDLLTEGTLPLEARGGQRRYTQVQRFSLFVAPGGGRVTLPGPDPARLPTNVEGSYLVLLRFEAVDDREGDSNLGSAGAGNGLVHSGTVAGFPMPILRYVVLGDGAIAAGAGISRLAPLAPRSGARFTPDSAVRLVWSGDRMAHVYRIDVETVDGMRVLRAFAPRTAVHYLVPGALLRGVKGALRWRVAALDGTGALLARTPWRRFASTAPQHP